VEVVRIESTEVPERTALAQLKPLGLGTMHVESLSSYFQRLADQHDVSPKVIAREFVLPRLGFNNRVGEVQTDRYWRSSFFSGMGEVPEQWCKALSELTGVDSLRCLTLLPLHGLIGMHGSASEVRRWCPHCIAESEARDQPYGQLLWEIGCVKACPKHEVLLVSGHGCGPEEAIPPLRIKPLPHLCWSCGRRLSLAVEDCIAAATDAEVRFARAVGEVLAGPLYHDGLHEVGRTIADFLTDAIQLYEEGYASRAVRRTGASKAGISGWKNGRHLPSLPQAFMLANAYGAQLSDALIGRGGYRWVGVSEAAPPKRVSYTPYRNRTHKLNTEAKRQEILRSPTPASAAQAAGMLGTSVRELRKHHPDYCHQVAERHSRWVKSEANCHREERLLVVEELVRQMVCEGVIPTIARLEERLVGIPKAFLFKERQACKRICEAAKDGFIT
jgi:hypothetical protein